MIEMCLLTTNPSPKARRKMVVPAMVHLDDKVMGSGA